MIRHTLNLHTAIHTIYKVPTLFSIHAFHLWSSWLQCLRTTLILGSIQPSEVRPAPIPSAFHMPEPLQIILIDSITHILFTLTLSPHLFILSILVTPYILHQHFIPITSSVFLSPILIPHASAQCVTIGTNNHS